MKVGYYLSGTKISDGGIFQYSIYVLKMLLNCKDITNICFFYSQDQEKVFEQFLLHPKVTPVLYTKKGRLYRFLKKVAELSLKRYYHTGQSSNFLHKAYVFLDPDRRALNKFKLDVLHVPRQHAPAYNLNYPVVISMHDVQQFHFPEFFTPLERIFKSISYYTSMSETDHAIVSFNHVKNDLNKYFPNISAEVSVCPVPVNNDWVSDTKWTSSAELQEKYKIPEQIILTPAATWEHKNHKAVLEAMALLRDRGIKVFWVSTGNKTSYYSAIEKRIIELGLEDQVLFTGVVSEIDLRGLYDMARLVVIPTLYEAGSGPLFEAMRYQTPVICSNTTSLPETIGNEEFVFCPNDYGKLADIIQIAFNDPGFITRNKSNSAERINYYKTLSYAPAFLEAYKKAGDHHKQFNLRSK